MQQKRRFASTGRRLRAPILHCIVVWRCFSSHGLRASHATRTRLSATKWAPVSGVVLFIVRRMDENTMLPGRGTALELAFSKRFATTKHAVLQEPPPSKRELQFAGLSLGYASAVRAANLLLDFLHYGTTAQAFILCVVDSMLPAARNLSYQESGVMKSIRLPEELVFACNVQQTLEQAGKFSAREAAFIASLRTKWTTVSMVQMCRDRDCWILQENARKWPKAIKPGGMQTLRSMVSWSAPCRRVISAKHPWGSKRCSACRSAWYCSEEHGALHWKEHKPICRATAVARHAAAGEGAGAA